MHVCRKAIARLSAIDDRDAPAGASEHQACTQPGWAATYNEHIAREIHTLIVRLDPEDCKRPCQNGKLYRMDEYTSLLKTVGPRLKEYRLRASLTLAHASELTAISSSTISRLESGGRKPTLELLLPLARAYNVALDELVRAPDARDPRVEQKPFVKDGMTFVPLTRNSGGLQAYKTIIPGRTGAKKLEQRVHDGYEWMYVLRGRLRLTLGDRDIVLKAGDLRNSTHAFPTRARAPAPNPWNSLVFSAAKANGFTFVPARLVDCPP